MRRTTRATRTLAALSLVGAGLLANGEGAGAQQVMAQVIPLVTRANPTAGGATLTEAYLTQPAVMADWLGANGRVGARLMLDFEGLTLQRGELNTGGFGEGYVDRRHPHTYVHEAVASLYAGRTVGGDPLRGSLSLGRGFAPFGSDDPMVRTFVKFPVNHHLAQLLERIVAIGAVRWRGVLLEGATFNGDEPVGAANGPRWERFGDSWSGRATIFPVGGVELSASHARVKSPEEVTGHGLDQRKHSIVARWERGPTQDPGGVARRDYVMAEWARTDDYGANGFAFRYSSLLAEAVAERPLGTLGLRVESTERPEEERLENPFRTPRPHPDLSNLGITRWTTVTLHLAPRVSGIRALSIRPFVEVARVAAEQTPAGGVFDPRAFYGTDRMWMLSTGARIALGGVHHRMGRYGAALPHAAPSPGSPHIHQH